jgi:DNA-directed RNA polymerase subunit RPC12/RpoP
MGQSQRKVTIMSMQFDISDKHQRKYQCFVCGEQFTDFAEYKEHIFKNHEEGNDYVKCPLQRCGAPVRDVKLHFKTRHPSEKVPAKCMMRALVWKDVAPPRRKKKDGKPEMVTRTPKFRQGLYESIKMNRNFTYKSGYECCVYELLDAWVEVVAFAVEPFKIPYTFEGEPHTYTPDILVNFVDGHCELWEIKPENQTALPKNKAKWKSAEAACTTRGWLFKVITEQVINQLKKKVANQAAMFS